MLIYKQEVFFSIILIAIMFFITLIIKRAIKKFSFVKSIEINRRKVIFNTSYLVIYIITGSILALIWGVDLKQFTVFISSILAVLGVGFFANWSILSNITASVILFFSHPIRIGDRIKIIDKDYNWIGEVRDITGFYFFMITDSGEKIYFPTSMVIQKGIQILDKDEIIITKDDSAKISD
ncbi:mechanosensitive ion channel domain-containing protein [Aquimarina algicola]|uniref:Mechanosensitive ion channel n=1 Tax=Aquimarina algicola TaxID=2589995 RepID=A0A504J9D8_9FLAO|nr:mechanosensitive ion channel domain-containing protein [Aquimarina algicola]TPN84488.1 mechanosensitive ion channel [Aquimarina algicola]